jgi:putative hemolysin
MLIFFLSVGLALGMSAFCSLLEATLLSFTPSQVAALEVKRPRLGRIWRSFKGNIEKPIAVILVVNTTAHTVGATIAGAQFEKVFGPNGLVIFSVVFTYLMLQFTEILPKSLGVRYNGFVAPLIGPLLEVLIRVMAPLIWFVQLVNRPFAGSDNGQEDNTLQQIAALASSATSMDPQQSRMIQAASDMENIRVRQIMTPRTEVMFLLTSQNTEEILDLLKKSPHTRLPLCDKTIDKVIGMVHTKDFIKTLDLTSGHFRIGIDPKGEDPVGVVDDGPGSKLHVFGSGVINLMNVRRDVLFLPDHTSLLQALRRFQASRLHLAVVVDEYGSTEGIVTLEDVLEEMVGDIRDEFDSYSGEMIKSIDDGFRVDGRCPLHILVQRVPNLCIDHAEEEADTVGGYVSHLIGHLPSKGDTIDADNYRWTVSLSDMRRVREVTLMPLETLVEETETSAE